MHINISDDQIETTELDLKDVAKKARKADLKAAEKAGKAAKEALKADKKAQRKIEKQKRKDAALDTKFPDLKSSDAKSEDVERKSKSTKMKMQNGVSSSMSLGAKLQAVARLARGNLAGALLKHGLYAGQEQVLFLLDEHGPLALAELAEKLDVRAPTITKTVTRMEAQGFLSRALSRDDARSIIISLTPDGRRVLKIGREIVVDIENRTFSVMSETDCKSLKKMLDLVFLQLKHK